MDLISFDDDIPHHPPHPGDNDDLKLMMVQQAEELFHSCDRDSKGYVTKNDMQHLVAILPLSVDQLDTVFDSLDVDSNGCLTLGEFTQGFGSFVSDVSMDTTTPFMAESVFELADDAEDYEANIRFDQMLRETGAVDVLPDMSTVKMLWCCLGKTEPALLGNFEDFVYKIAHNMKHTNSEFSSLQAALRSKNLEHDAEIQKLYEEMEQQIRQERDLILTEEKAKERSLRQQMDKELRDKDAQLQEIMNKHQQLEDRLSQLNFKEAETKQENDRLLKERQDLETMLLESRQELEQSQLYVNNLKELQKAENRERARSALQVTEGIVMERESLIKQLDMLRDMNKKLRDEHDVTAEAFQPADFALPHNGLHHQGSTLSSYLSNDEGISHGAKQKRRDHLHKQGSILSDYVGSSTPKRSIRTISQNSSGEDLDIDYKNRIEHIDISPVRESNLMSYPHLNNLEDYEDDIECDDPLVDETASDFGHNFVNNYDNADDDEVFDQSTNCHTQYLESELLPKSAAGYSQRGLSRKESVNEVSDETGDVPLGQVTVNEGEARAPAASRRHRYTHIKVGRGNGADVITSSDTDGMSQPNRRLRKPRKKASPAYSAEPRSTTEMVESDLEETSTSGLPVTRYQPVGASPNVSGELVASGDIPQETVSTQNPQRVFKVVFVGDSGVGKSSFIHRFCNNQFNAAFSATIGVDFQVRSLNVDGDVVALQLWDTAGQERFRSITKQYFRKADGVLIMYDVMCEKSFTNIRNWMSSVAEGVEQGTAIIIIGNKIDLVTDKTVRHVATKSAQSLANSNDCMFWETSAKSGHNVTECMLALASLLKEKEDRELEKAITLEEMAAKRKSCCARS